jgi:hypothetical protein
MLIELTVLVIEAPTLNLSAKSGTLISAEDWAMRILETAHGFYLDAVGEFVAAQQAVEPAEVDGGKVAYRVRLQCLGAASQRAKVAAPAVSEVNGAIQATCETAGADIYLTLDGSFPGPGNSAALRYEAEAPVAVQPGMRLRAAAYREGLRGSDVFNWVSS